MDEELNDLHQLSSVVFTNIAGITPNMKNLISSAKAFHKSYQGTVGLGTQFVQSLEIFAQSAMEAKGATHSVGETLNDIIAIFCEIEAMKGDLMNVFMNEVIIPLDNSAEQEVNMSKLAYKQYMQDNKIQTEIVGKLAQDIVKLRKKSQKKKGKAGKYEQKEGVLLEDYQNEEKTLRAIREQGLRRALIGERRIYCFLAERICNFGRGMAIHSNKVASMLNDKIDVWNKVVSNPGELPSESESVVMNPSMHYTATMRRKKQNMVNQAKTNTNDNRMNTARPSVIGKESFETIPEDGIPDQIESNETVNGNDRHDESEKSSDAVPNEVIAEMIQKKAATNGDMRYSMVPNADGGVDKDIISTVGAPQLKALYGHAGKDNSQLSFAKGDLIFKLSEPTGGWQYGKHQVTEKCGWFPAAYAQVIAKQSPVIPSFHGKPMVPIPTSQNGPSRRSSTPATSSPPFIPAPDYDDFQDSSDVSQFGIRSGSAGTREFHHSVSSPGLSSGFTPSTNIMGPNREIVPPSELGYQQSNLQNGGTVAMPLPPPPPTFEVDETNDGNDNPFAGIKLKKTVTNDRSMPNIAQ